MGRAIRRRNAVLSVVVLTLVSAGSLSLGMPASTAVANTCRARNVTQDSAVSSNLQAVIRDAVGGDVISVKFVCVGNFTIAKNLTLVGRPTAGLPRGLAGLTRSVSEDAVTADRQHAAVAATVGVDIVAVITLLA